MIDPTYFHNAMGLRPGAKVRANGLKVGTVKKVSLDPRLGNRPVEVLLRLDRRCAGSIPNDATTSLATEGIFGQTLIDIDVSNTTGAPVANNAILKSVEIGDCRHVLEPVSNVLKELSKQLDEHSKKLQERQVPQPPTAPRSQKP